MFRREATLAVAVLWTVLFTEAHAFGQSHASPVEVSEEFNQLVAVMELRSGMAVADVGAGSGEWTTALAARVGPTGLAYATEISPSSLESLRSKAKNVPNMLVVQGTERSANLPAECCDAILLRDVYHHLTHPEDMARSLAAAIKPGGRLVVIDRPPAPPVGGWTGLLGHSISDARIIQNVASFLTHSRTIAAWPAGRGEYYLLLFRKATGN